MVGTISTTKYLVVPVSRTMAGAKLLINSLTLMHGYMTSITEMAGAITLTIEQLRDWWDLQVWKASEENRELVRERLRQQAMKDGSCKSPYFDYD